MYKILILIFLSSSVFGSFLLDKNSPICIEDFYYKSSRIYYQQSKDDAWKSTSEDHTSDHIRIGYKYDSDDDSCRPEPYLILGMDVADFHFLLGLVGVFFGFTFLVFTIYLFVNVGREK